MRKLYVEVKTKDAARFMAAPGAITTQPRERTKGKRCIISLRPECAEQEPWASAGPMNVEAVRLLLASAHYTERD
jgi:hypothetical protein